MEKGPCESCRAKPPPSGRDGTWGMHDYCVHCSKDLCDACFSKPCRENPGGTHEKEPDE